MTYKRKNNRKFDEVRPMEAKVGVVKRANGSAMFKIGNTVAIAAVYGPRTLYPSHLQDPQRGVLRCNYNMIAFSGSDRVRPGPSRRSKEISMVTENALKPSLMLEKFDNSVIDVYIEMVNADAGTRCAGITAASLALADAGIPMKDLVCAVSVGKVKNTLITDLDYDEDSAEVGVDIPVAMMANSGKITLMQMDGIIKKEEVSQSLKNVKKAIKEISELQIKALKEKYEK